MRQKIFIFIVLPLIITLYFPMFGKIIPIISNLPYNFAKYSMPFIFIFILATLIINRKWEKVDKHISKLLLFNLYYLTNLLFKGFVEDLFMPAINLSIGLILTTLVIVFLSQQKEFGRDKNLFDFISTGIGIMLIHQILVSALESASGTLFGEYDINIESSIVGRDFLSIFNLNQEHLFGFSVPFTGLIGQHNGFGIMLVFYNIFFMTQYERTRKKYLLIYFILIIFALIGNGTRSALFLVFVIDILFFFMLQRKSMGFVGILLIIVSLVITIAPFLYDLAVRFYFQIPSIGSRIFFWEQILSQYLIPKGFLNLLLGMSISDIRLIGVDIVGHTTSVESEYIRLYLYTGLFGLLLFVSIFFNLLYRRSFPFSQIGINSIRVLVLSIFFMSVFMTGITYYATYILIALTILDHIHHNLIFEKGQNKFDNIVLSLNKITR